MAPEDYLRRYAEPFQSLPMAGSAAPGDWQALLLEPDCYYPPDLELGSGLDTLNRVDLLDILRQILATEYPQQGLSRDTVREFLEALQRLKDERVRRQAEIERLNGELAWRVDELANLGAERKRLESLLESCRSQISILENQCATLRETLAVLRGSTSWKVTKPLRWFGRIVKAGRTPDS